MAKLTHLSLLALASMLNACKPAPVVDSSENGVFKSVSQTSQGLKQTNKNYEIKFPLDHGAHSEFGIEWWYLTANLIGSDGKDYGLQWTLFRIANPEGKTTPWNNNQSFMAHSSLHGSEKSWFEQKFARGNVGTSGVSIQPFNAFIDDWVFNASGSNLIPATLQFSIESDLVANLQLSTEKPLVLHGDNGYSEKFYAQDGAESPASYYYSQPYIEVSGQLALPDKTIEVSGDAWFDHEWTSQVLPENTSGWDWFALHLSKNSKLMLARVRHETQADHWIGTYISDDGNVFPLTSSDIKAKINKTEEVEGRNLPLNWSISIEKFGVDLETKPMKVNQWVPGLVAYYEGAIKFDGSHTGKGFMELTGY